MRVRHVPLAAMLLFAGALALAVPARAAGQAPAKAPAATKPAPAKPAEAKPAAPKAQPIDINTATQDELKAIPGIGDAYAAKIIAGRPYQKKDQLVSKNILPKDVYAKVKDNIIAKKVEKPAPPAKPAAAEKPRKAEKAEPPKK